METNELDKGLWLLGWRADSRVTPDEGRALEAIAQEALDLSAKEALSEEVRDGLALRAFEILEFQVTSTQERALMAGVVYPQSKYLAYSVHLVDEATICYYRGYYAASLALLFIVTERALLRMTGWEQGRRKPNFPTLATAVRTMPNSEAASEATAILEVVYGQYLQPSDSPFGFNRHSVHHGLRDFSVLDKMNCVRAFLLLDILVAAEGLSRGACGDEFDALALRRDVYEAVVSSGREMKLIRPGDERLPKGGQARKPGG